MHTDSRPSPGALVVVHDFTGPVLKVGSPVTPLNADVLLQMVQQNDDKSEEGHHRLRQDIRSLEGTMSRIDTRLTELSTKVNNLENKQPVLSNVLLPWQMFVGAVMLTTAIVGGMWGITYGLRSDVRDLVTSSEAHSKLEEERSNNLKEAVGEQKKMQELQRIQLESLTKTVLTQQRRN